MIHANISLADFQRMISLAEEVSKGADALIEKRIEIYTRAISLLAAISLPVLIIVAATYWFAGFNRQLEIAIFGGCFGVFSGASLMTALRTMRALNRNKYSFMIEQAVLKDLMTMLYEAKDFVTGRSTVDSVEFALLEMRLKRIKFSIDFSSK